MGRKAGVAAEETRAALLGSAAKVFARRGYDGASISEIVSEAGLTSGAIYAHFASKAELFAATLRAYAERDLDRVLSGGAAQLMEGLTSVGASFDRPEPTEASLLVSAIIAARNDPEVAALVGALLAERETFFKTLVQEAQAAGVLAPAVSAPAVSRLSLMIAMGSLVVGALSLPDVEHAEWAAVIDRVVRAFEA
ncbi:MAG TPA: TetR family transcriptional regulator [Acidimicrobiales bacterium]|nr:TetR family transcriptional regulator [Acidimicrobiales bacterium]